MRTNSIAGTKPNILPNFHLNLNNINKKVIPYKDKSKFANFTLKNNCPSVTQFHNQKSKEQLANIINIYTSNMNNFKAKEINLKQFVNNKFNRINSDSAHSNAALSARPKSSNNGF